MRTTVKLSARGTVTLPKNMRQSLALNRDDILVAETTASGILLRPASVYPTELYSDEQLAVFEQQNNRAIQDIFPDRRARGKKG
jgi:bifunctional DNA-binding transcriptional regulator/antitoxin component of YhaV-PrlF toxin-antitoxin module